MCLACLSGNWWSLWSLSVNAAAVAKGQAARWRLGRVGWHMLGWGGYKREGGGPDERNSCIQMTSVHRSPPPTERRPGAVIEQLQSTRASRNAQRNSKKLSLTHTHSWALVPVCCLTLETLCVCKPAWACQPGMILGASVVGQRTCGNYLVIIEGHSKMGSLCQSNQLVLYYRVSFHFPLRTKPVIITVIIIEDATFPQ